MQTMTRPTAVRPFAALCAAACCVAPAMAATPWTTPAGTSDTVTYAHGQTDHARFTPDGPAVGDDTFVFTPADFSAQDNQTTDDTAAFTLTAKKNTTLTSVSADLTGDYSTLYGGPEVSATPSFRPSLVVYPTVYATGLLTVTNPATHASFTSAFFFGDQFAMDDGGFSGHVNIQLPPGWKSAQVSLASELHAMTPQGSTAFIQLKGATVGAQTHAAAVPLPPAALAAIPGAILAYAAGRRFRRTVA